MQAGAADGLCPRCLMAEAMQPTVEEGAEPSPAPDLEAVAGAFPDLEVLGLIGRGGMGAVFKARQKSLDRYVALKILPQALAADPKLIDAAIEETLRFDAPVQFLMRKATRPMHYHGQDVAAGENVTVVANLWEIREQPGRQSGQCFDGAGERLGHSQ